jgi:hypothetical protein
MINWPNKDPEAVLDYVLDWTDELDGDTITSASWDVPAGLTLDNESNTTTACTVWLSGGVTGTNYRLVNEVTTAAGRTDQRTVSITVKDK